MSNEFYKRNLAVPFFTQRDNTYIWQQKTDEIIYDDNDPTKIKYNVGDSFGPKYPMAWRSCNITSLCMVLHYWGLTEESPDQMLEKVFSRQEENVLDDNGALKTDKNGNPVTKWGWLHEATDEDKHTGACRIESWENLKDVAELYIEGKDGCKAVQGEESLTMELIQEQIARGVPVIASTGLASLHGSGGRSGHIVVVRGFTDDGDVILNDPFGAPVDNGGRTRQAGKSGGIYGWYYSSAAASAGDNIIIDRRDFEARYAEGTSKYLYIEGPLWQQPGGEETDATNSFPIRSDNMWHNGIHLESESGFRSIGAGRLVAARNSEVENHGSSSFALIKYQMPESHGQFFYALYMHLKKIDLKQELEDFFLKNNGNVSENLRNTWYEQIFSNLLPAYAISYYSEKRLVSGQQEDIYEAEIVNKKIRAKKSGGGLVKAKLDDSNTGIESRHMKCYMVPPEKLDILCDIENYKNMSKLKFMLKAIKSGKGYSPDFEKDGYLFFYCGNNGSRKLCCIKKDDFDLNSAWQIYNEAAYKYYTEKLYSLYAGDTVIFSRIDTERRNKILEKIRPENVLGGSVLEYMPVYHPNSKLLLGLHSKRGLGSIPAEQAFHRLKQDIQTAISDIEHIFIVFAETGKSAGKKDLEKYFDNYKKARKAQLESFLKEATRYVDGSNAGFGSIEKRADAAWMKELFEDAERLIDAERTTGRKGSYDAAKILGSMRSEFEKILNEYKKADLVNSIAVCEFLMIEFTGLPTEKLAEEKDRFKFESFEKPGTFKFLYGLWAELMEELEDSYSIFFYKRYIDNYIEIPKGAKIGEGSDIPDTAGEEAGGVHLEIFSKENLFAGGISVEDDGLDTFYSPSVISNRIISALNLPEAEQRRLIKYSDDNVILRDEIERLYKETGYFKKMVAHHLSEWKTRKYKDTDIKAITNKKVKVKDEILETLDYYNRYYGKYNWLDKRMEDEIGGDKFYYYHPETFINFLYSELTNKYILKIRSLSSKPADGQYALLRSIVHDENLTGAEKGILASELRKEREAMKLEDLFDESDEAKYNFMNRDLRDFLNLKEDGTTEYKMHEIKRQASWKKMPFLGSLYHQKTAKHGFNTKYVNMDGREVVFNADTKMITEYPDKGTYNYCNGTFASTFWGKHKEFDIKAFNNLKSQGI